MSDRREREIEAAINWMRERIIESAKIRSRIHDEKVTHYERRMAEIVDLLRDLRDDRRRIKDVTAEFIKEVTT